MFQDKNQNKSSDTQAPYFDYNSVPLHLMKDDLEEAKNPKKASAETSQKTPEKNLDTTKLSEKQKTSPFFNSSSQEKAQKKTPRANISFSAPQPAKENLENKFVPQPFKETSQLPKKVLKPIETFSKLEQESLKPAEDILKQESVPADFIKTSTPFKPRLEPKATPVEPSEPPKKMTFKESPKSSIVIKGTKTKNAILGKVLYTLATLLIVFAVGASGYYFWNANKEKQSGQIAENEISPNPISEEASQPEPIIEPEPEIDFATDKPNYLQIDIQNTDKDLIKERFDLYLAKAEEKNIDAPVEFIITDSNNELISFKVFIEKTGIILSETVLKYLEDTFNLFIYNDDGAYRLGLTIDSLNNTSLKTELFKEEGNLITNLDPILKNPESKEILSPAFSNSSYKNTIIRYSNIVSPEYLSIDYVIYKDKLIFATTKNMIYALMDYLSVATITTTTNPETSTTPETLTDSEAPATPDTANITAPFQPLPSDASNE